MKTFKRHKTYDEVQAQCSEQGLYFGNTQYLRNGYDTVKVSSAAESRDNVIYNTTNGRFFGLTDKGVSFNSDQTMHDDQDWFQALLSFFYVEKDHG